MMDYAVAALATLQPTGGMVDGVAVLLGRRGSHGGRCSVLCGSTHGPAWSMAQQCSWAAVDRAVDSGAAHSPMRARQTFKKVLAVF
ncbi:hypothetical protein ABZP36_014280 [Zizania latifolia]